MPRSAQYLELQRENLARVRALHPYRRSDCGAVLDEFLTAPELEDQVSAVYLFAGLECRRGFKRMENALPELLRKVEAETDEWIGPPERRLFAGMLYAIAQMDTPESHACLVHLLHNSPSHLVRDDVLEAMAFEKRQYDRELILPFLALDCSTPEILSALYALQYKGYVTEQPEDALARVLPLLDHPHVMVTVYVIELLKEHPPNLARLLQLRDHPSPHVQKALGEAVAYAETMADDE
jgi:hypothetical protein